MERGTHHADNRDAHRQTASVHPRIESIRLHDGVKAVTLRPDHLFYQGRSLQYVMQARKGLLFPYVMQNVTTTEIFGIVELDRCAGSSVTRQQVNDSLFACRVILARKGMIECQNSHVNLSILRVVLLSVAQLDKHKY